MNKELIKGDGILYISVLLGAEAVYLLHNGNVWGGIALGVVILGALLWRVSIKTDRLNKDK